jgi:ABC-type antimicrobial peptide transport system permease subunit
MFGMMMHLPFYIPWQNFVIGLILPVLLGVISGLVPARKAANLDPVVALS